MQDLVKWSLKDENRAIQDALTQVGELFSIWTEVQRELNDHIKEFKHQFDMILEGAKQLDVAKGDLQQAEMKEGKIKKELKKAAKKATAEELREMSVRLGEAEREKDLALLEVGDRAREHEAVKMIRVKEGLFKISEAYIDYAQKCDVIFQAQRDIALQIPDVHDKDIQDIKYTGAGSTMLAVSRAKEKIKRFRRRPSSYSLSCTPAARMSPAGCHDMSDLPAPDLPPPYSENPPLNPFYNDLVHNVSHGSQPSDQERLSLDRSHQYLDLDISGRRSGGGGDSRFTGVSDRVSPMYPALSNIPPYSSPPVGHPPQFSNVTRRGGFGRRDSYLSDTDDPAAMMGNLKLQPH